MSEYPGGDTEGSFFSAQGPQYYVHVGSLLIAAAFDCWTRQSRPPPFTSPHLSFLSTFELTHVDFERTAV